MEIYKNKLEFLESKLEVTKALENSYIVYFKYQDSWRHEIMCENDEIRRINCRSESNNFIKYGFNLQQAYVSLFKKILEERKLKFIEVFGLIIVF